MQIYTSPVKFLRTTPPLKILLRTQNQRKNVAAASAEPDKLRLGGVSESRPLTISIIPVTVASA